MQNVTPGTVLADRYVIGDPIGVGGTGVVWRAEDRLLERTVAIKVVTGDEAAQRLAREARAAAGVNDPCVVAVHDAGFEYDVQYLVMEHVEGVDLSSILKEGPLHPDVAALVGRDLARGLGAVHEAGIVHRDVKPANVLVTNEGDVKLADLGIARGSDGLTRLTQTGQVVGTVDYLAPEQLGEGEITTATDVYAAGLLIHECCTGEPPFGEGGLAERAARRLTSDPPTLAQATTKLQAALASATARRPEDRPPHGHALRALLGGTVEDDLEPRLRAELAQRARKAAAARPPVAVPQVLRTDPGPGTSLPSGPVTTFGGASGPHAPTTGPGGSGPIAAHSLPPMQATAAFDAAAASGEHTVAPNPNTTVQFEPVEGGGGSSRSALVRGLLVPLVASVAAIVALVLVLSPAPEVALAEEAPVPVVAVTSFDPLGDGQEHEADAPYAVDDDPITRWTSEDYGGPTFDGQKDGVGLLLDLGAQVNVHRVVVDAGGPIGRLHVVVEVEPPTEAPIVGPTLLGWVGGETGDGPIEVVGAAPLTGRWVTLWFTELEQVGGTYRAVIDDVEVVGTTG